MIISSDCALTQPIDHISCLRRHPHKNEFAGKSNFQTIFPTDFRPSPYFLLQLTTPSFSLIWYDDKCTMTLIRGVCTCGNVGNMCYAAYDRPTHATTTPTLLSFVIKMILIVIIFFVVRFDENSSKLVWLVWLVDRHLNWISSHHFHYLLVVLPLPLPTSSTSSSTTY